jgi:hypothetical protein
MVAAAPPRDAGGMDTAHQYESIATSTFELRRAAERVQQRASAPDTVAALPLALTDIEKTLERLARGAADAANAVEESGPEARALRWHLFHLAARLRSAADASPDARRWAHALLAHPDVAARPPTHSPAAGAPTLARLS